MAFDASALLGKTLGSLEVQVDTALFSFTLDELGPSGGPSQPSRLLGWLRPAVTVRAKGSAAQLYRTAPYGDPPPPPDPAALLLIVAGVGVGLLLVGAALAVE